MNTQVTPHSALPDSTVRGANGGQPRRPLADVDGCQMRLHSTTLYASLFRYDDQIMANPHAYGEPASANPVLHLRRLDGGQVTGHYMAGQRNPGVQRRGQRRRLVHPG